MTVWNPISLETDKALERAGLPPGSTVQLLEQALDEDLGGGVDVTTVATVPKRQFTSLDLVSRDAGVVAGIAPTRAVFDLVMGDEVQIDVVIEDGERVQPGDRILRVTGPTRALLLAERTSLNVLSHLSGIATQTDQWVQQLRGSKAQVRDTRKTTPGLRSLEKYAVRCGGGRNHRMSLSDAALVKDNHVLAAGGVQQAFAAVREQFPGIAVEIEVDSLEQLDQALAAGADLVLLDNFSPEQLTNAVRMNSGRARLEASGGLTLESAAVVAGTGVDYIAVGAITHSAPVLDIGADLIEPEERI